MAGDVASVGSASLGTAISTRAAFDAPIGLAAESPLSTLPSTSDDDACANADAPNNTNAAEQQ
jgi:hypothetical protein